MSNIQEVKDICEALIKDDVLYLSPATVIHLDGTSCTRKTSTLKVTEYPVTKIQHETPLTNTDTYGPSMFGYIVSGMIQQRNDSSARFNDRSPLNVLEWCMLWRLMSLFKKTFGNVLPIFDKTIASAAMIRYLDTFDCIFFNLKEAYYYKHFRDQINALALIDTNVDRCDKLHCKRNEGNDAERSEWKYYTSLQNRMYQILYEDACIDLNLFNNASIEDTTIGIATFLKEKMSRLIEINLNDRINHCKRQLDEFRRHGIIKGDKFPLNPISVHVRDVDTSKNNASSTTMRPRDITLINATAHVYRLMGRIKCKTIMPQEINKMRNNREEEELLLTTQQIPSYLDVTTSTSSSSSLILSLSPYEEDDGVVLKKKKSTLRTATTSCTTLINNTDSNDISHYVEDYTCIDEDEIT